jgi:hypothetical protein
MGRRVALRSMRPAPRDRPEPGDLVDDELGDLGSIWPAAPLDGDS